MSADVFGAHPALRSAARALALEAFRESDDYPCKLTRARLQML